MSLGIAAHTSEGSILITDSVTRVGNVVQRDSRKNFRVPSINAGVFASGTFSNLASMIDDRIETDFDEVERQLFADLQWADQTSEPYSPQLLLVTADRISLMTPEYGVTGEGSMMLAAGGWVSWFLKFNGINVNSEQWRFDTEDMPETLDECRTMMRSLAKRCASMWQNPPLVAPPFYELTFRGGLITEEVFQ